MRLIHAVFLSIMLSVSPLAATYGKAESPQSRKVEGYYKGQIVPHWLTDNERFWYRNDLSGNTKEFILVDAEQGTRQLAFDRQKLAIALSKSAS